MQVYNFKFQILNIISQLTVYSLQLKAPEALSLPLNYALLRALCVLCGECSLFNKKFLSA